MRFALFYGNRGFFPGELIASAREEVKKAVEKAGHDYLMMGSELTRYGAVETTKEGKLYADFLKEHQGEYDGVILSMPNFSDENGAIAALRDCGVPILIQAYPDEINKMDFLHRRDSYCGKFSIMDVFYQFQLPFTIFKPHVVHPNTTAFAEQLKKFAAVCRVVKGMRKFTIGAIGARTTAFKTVRFDELALQKYGISTETIDLSDLFARMNALKADDVRVQAKLAKLLKYSDCGNVPKEKMISMAKTGVALDDLISEYYMDCVAIRCWNEFENIMGISPCLLLSELNDRGIVAACELDVMNAVSMRALSLASEKPATVLDWNNNYGDEENKVILFHCGPVATSLMVPESGHVTEHPMFAKSYGAGCGWGCNEGRIAPNKLTFLSAKTENGRIVFYSGEGEFTTDEIESGFFGCAGVAKIADLENKLLKIGQLGFRHHVSVSIGHVNDAIQEAFKYLGYEVIGW